MCSVAYSCDRAIMLCVLSLMLMHRHFNKPYVLMLHAVLFSLFQCASTVVTYMIVLLQFEQSDKSQNACRRNMTNWVTWRVELVCDMWQRKLHILFQLPSLLLLLLLLSSQKGSSLLSKQQHAVSDGRLFLRDRLHLWVDRPVGASRQLDLLFNCRVAMSGIVKLNTTERRR